MSGAVGLQGGTGEYITGDQLCHSRVGAGDRGERRFGGVQEAGGGAGQEVKGGWTAEAGRYVILEYNQLLTALLELRFIVYCCSILAIMTNIHGFR